MRTVFLTTEKNSISTIIALSFGSAGDDGVECAVAVGYEPVGLLVILVVPASELMQG